jgi:hypothetical protein
MLLLEKWVKPEYASKSNAVSEIEEHWREK